MAFRSLASGERYNKALVVDNSVMMRWLFEDGSDADQNYAKSVLQSIKAEEITVLVPYIWVYESAFVTHYYTRRNALSADEAISHLDALFELSTVIRGEAPPSQLFELAQTCNVSSYDASYLLLARQQDCPLATLDKKMQKACRQLGGSLYK